MKLALGIGLALASVALAGVLLLRSEGRAPADPPLPGAAASAPRRVQELGPGAAPGARDEGVAAARELPRQAPRADEPPGATRPLVVRVLDAGGAPVEGIGVRVVMRRAKRLDRVDTTTDASGTARFDDLERRPFAKDPSARWSAGVRLLTAAPLERAIPADPHPPEPLLLRLPPTGTLVVTAREADGTPLRDGSPVSVRVVSDASPAPSSALPWEIEEHGATLRGGEARFPFVALGLELEASVGESMALGPVLATGPGPARPGAEARLEVVRESPVTELRLRLVDEAGTPLARRRVALWYAEAGSSGGSPRETDDEGRMQIALPPEPVPGATRWLDLRLGATAAHVDLARAFPPGPCDLGDVVLAEPPALLAGVVVDAEGAPVQHVSLLALALDPNGVERPGVGWPLQTFSAADGSFAIAPSPGLAADVPARYALHATAKGLCGDLPSVARGTHDVVLQLVGAGEIAGSLRTDPGVPTGRLELRAFPQGDGYRSSSRTLSPRRDGSFLARGIAAGLWTLVVSVSGQEVRRIEGVRVVAGEATDDPRLSPIDLSGQIFTHALSFEAPDGSPLRWVGGAAAFAAHGARPSLARGRIALSSPLALFSATPSVDVLLLPDEWRRELVLDVGAERTVRLRPALRVRLVLAPDSALPDPPLALLPSLVPEGELDALPAVLGPALGPDRSAVLPVPAAGAFRVAWMLARGDSTPKAVELGPPRTIEVVDSPVEQVFELSYGEQDLERALSGSR